MEEYRAGRGKLSGASFWKKRDDTDAAPSSTDNSNGKPTPEALRPRVIDKNISQNFDNASAVYENAFKKMRDSFAHREKILNSNAKTYFIEWSC